MDELVKLAQVLGPCILLASATGIIMGLFFNYRVARTHEHWNRRDQFWSSSVLSAAFVESAKLHWRDHFHESYDSEYWPANDDDTKLRSYLLMKQKYMYLVFQQLHKDLSKYAADKWLSELTQYREFRHVHRSHAKYYPKLAQAVNQLILDSKIEDQDTPWMFEANPNATPHEAET